jgi:AcrR family transcriptional regulator
MKEKKDDRRIRYTKRVIQESFVHLLSQKPIAKITVKEICEGADVNRSTFYAHYLDPYDLMKKVKGEVLEEINIWIGGLVSPVDSPGAYQVMKLVFEYVLANAELCKVLLGVHGDEELQEEIMMIAQQQVMREWPGKQEAGAGLLDYLAQFGVYAGVAVVKKWLEKGLKEPPEEMAELVIRLIYHGLYSVVSKRPGNT